VHGAGHHGAWLLAQGIEQAAFACAFVFGEQGFQRIRSVLCIALVRGGAGSVGILHSQAGGVCGGLGLPAATCEDLPMRYAVHLPDRLGEQDAQGTPRTQQRGSQPLGLARPWA
jgi:hypothetical protein